MKKFLKSIKTYLFLLKLRNWSVSNDCDGVNISLGKVLYIPILEKRMYKIPKFDIQTSESWIIFNSIDDMIIEGDGLNPKLTYLNKNRELKYPTPDELLVFYRSRIYLLPNTAKSLRILREGDRLYKLPISKFWIKILQISHKIQIKWIKDR